MVPSLDSKGIAQRVARSAAWLDAVCPGWERKIDLEALDIGHPWGNCMLCQISRTLGFVAAMRWATSKGIALDAPELNGFRGILPIPGSDEFIALTEAWTAFIKERFSYGLLSDQNPSGNIRVCEGTIWR